MNDKPAVLKIADRPHAPFIYFEGAAVYGFHNGIAALTLIANTAVIDGDGGIKDELVAVAFLRCNLVALKELKAAVDQMVLLSMPTAGDVN